MRRLSSLLVSLEHPHRAVDAMLRKFAEWESELAAAAPTDNAPRIGELPDDPRRVYLNHATDIGAYNPCFPEYRSTNSMPRMQRALRRVPTGV